MILPPVVSFGEIFKHWPCGTQIHGNHILGPGKKISSFCNPDNESISKARIWQVEKGTLTSLEIAISSHPVDNACQMLPNILRTKLIASERLRNICNLFKHFQFVLVQPKEISVSRHCVLFPQALHVRSSRCPASPSLVRSLVQLVSLLLRGGTMVWHMLKIPQFTAFAKEQIQL